MDIISLGAGVQSTTLLLMAAHGELEPKPKYAVFSDTGWEPKVVYEHLEWLKKEAEKFGIEIVVTSRGTNIKEDLIKCATEGKSMPSIPFYVKYPSGKINPMKRQCTLSYKIEPVTREVQRLAGHKPYQKRGRKPITLWLGISWDEIHRIQKAHRVGKKRVKWIHYRYPLIEKEMTREDCIKWLHSKGYPTPPKSSCIGCPFHSNKSWRNMREYYPEEFQEAIEMDKLIRHLPKIKGEVYIHYSGEPLWEADLGEDKIILDECSGFCDT